MFDAKLRSILDPGLNRLGYFITQRNISANSITVVGFFIGISAVPLISLHYYTTALVCIFVNRLFDGLDGAVARQSHVSDVGGYLDIVLDFIFYSAIVFAFAIAQPENAIYSAFLIFSFIGTGSSFLAFAIFAEKRGLTTETQGKKSIYYLAGLAEGFETITTLALMCLFPHWFWIIALCFAAVCWLSVIFRMISSVDMLSEPGQMQQ